MTNPYSEQLSSLWDKHEVTLHGQERRTTRGVIPGQDTTVMASVNAGARTVRDAQGNEVVASATVRWRGDGPLPEVESHVSLPDYFGIKGRRKVITSQRIISNTSLTPDRVEVTLQ